MSIATLCLAAALLVAPGSVSARRLRPRTGPSSGSPRAAPLPAVAVAVTVGITVSAGIGLGVAVALASATALTRRRHRNRATALDDERRMLLSGLDTAIAELAVGAHPADACDTAAAETTGATSGAFRVAAARARLGGSASEGFRHGANADDGIDASLARVADAWSVSDRHGLALAELLGAARSDLSARVRLRGRTESGLAGARATATVLAALPALGVALGQLMGASPLSILLGGGMGSILLTVGTALVCAGLWWTDRIAEKASR